ncbi:hypothetical protein Poli38472_012876 [Pythium oligandrum]|uniref:Protein odr-4 homolog n=1 Tax=Pythium oligandrum TaxID=41045 RepID=A0A8K1CIL8_PYTOL|nr:hypothetical protein Poli38472_012876 [Pythium oligandrum]|eukprot:TMW64254.1 hypothetical protein Poli38472_012876 [Pythium oligandrum]
MTMSRSRQVHVASSVDAYWSHAIQQRRRFEMGLLVGQSGVLSACDTVLAATQVPAECEDEAVASFEDVSSDWVCDVAKQVDRMLPGGIKILGLYVISASDPRSVMDQASCYLRAIAEAVAIPTEFQSGLETDDVQCIVHISPSNSKRVAKSFWNLLDAAKTAANPAELKSPSTASCLETTQYTATIAIDQLLSFAHLKVATEQPVDPTVVIEKRVDEARQQLLPFVQRIWHARGIKSRQTESSSQRIDFLASFGATSSSAASKEPVNSTGRCQGVIECTAFVPADETSRPVDLAVLYLKQDFVKSLLVRIELLLERWTDDSIVGSATQSRTFLKGSRVVLPKRALLPWHSGVTTFSEALRLSLHIFPDDHAIDAAQNALEILGATQESEVDEAQLEWLEDDSKPHAHSTQSFTATSATQAAGLVATASPSSSNTLFVLLPVALLLLALIMQFLR